MQAFALAGCLVTGTLARRRRLEVEGLNARLRQINSELLKRGTVEVPGPLTRLQEAQSEESCLMSNAQLLASIGALGSSFTRECTTHCQRPKESWVDTDLVLRKCLSRNEYWRVAGAGVRSRPGCPG